MNVEGTQPLKIVFSHNIDDNYVRRHGFDIYPDTELNRTYTIDKNNLYLDTNEIIMESNQGGNIDITRDNYKDFDLSEADLKRIEDDMESLYSDDELTSEDDLTSDEDEIENENNQEKENQETKNDTLLDESELDLDLEEVRIH